jgi:hypothetical protein
VIVNLISQVRSSMKQESPMALQGPIPVEFSQVFPEGVYAAGGFEAVRDFVRVEFSGLTVTPYVNQAGRLAYSLKATGVRGLGGRPAGRPGSDGGRETAA